MNNGAQGRATAQAQSSCQTADQINNGAQGSEEQWWTRREFVATLASGLGFAAHAQETASPIVGTQPLPEPKVLLPTDDVPRIGPPKRIAAITTVYWKYSHADDIITKFIEGYAIVGRIHRPHCRVVSLYIDQFPETDIGRGLAARYKIPIFKTPAEALTLGGKELAVDGVLLIGEHGNYPTNEKGQTLYPRRE
ncbi:hypothetical protein HRbin36_00040 [bacterium HR36]|nr:hypothetical protein HRbin36_00040 [bacterium HR36]